MVVDGVETFKIEAGNAAYSGDRGMPLVRADGSVAGVATDRILKDGHVSCAASFVRSRDIVAFAKRGSVSSRDISE